MPNVNQASLREEFATLKGQFEQLSAAGKVKCTWTYGADGKALRAEEDTDGDGRANVPQDDLPISHPCNFNNEFTAVEGGTDFPVTLDDGQPLLDTAGTGGDGCLHHRRIARVDRDRHRQRSAEGLDHGDHPAQLFLQRNRRGPGPGRFTADVDNRGTRCDHIPCVFKCGFRRKKNTPVREGVGGDIEYTHDLRP